MKKKKAEKEKENVIGMEGERAIQRKIEKQTNTTWMKKKRIGSR